MCGCKCISFATFDNIYIYMNLCVSTCTYMGEYIHVPLENGLQTSPKIGLLEAHLGSSILELLQ